MSLFLFEASTDCMAWSATTDEGVGVGALDGPEPDDVSHVHIQLQRAYKRYQSGNLPDRLCIPGTNLFVVSDLIQNVINRFDLEQGIRFIPATIETFKTRRALGEYWFGYPNKEWDILDYQLADVQLIPGTDVVEYARRWVVDYRTVPGLDCFYSFPGDWIVTERLKYALEIEGATGIKFIPIETSHEE